MSSGRPSSVSSCAACSPRHASATTWAARPEPTDHARGVLALEQLHHHEQLAAGLAELVDLDDVRVVDHRADARLVDEHRDERLLPREVRQDPLDHHRAARGLAAEVQLAHAARREEPEHAVVPDALRYGCYNFRRVDHATVTLREPCRFLDGILR
jgi:hypothetical protein